MCTRKKLGVAALVIFAVLVITGATNFSRLAKLYNNSSFLKDTYRAINLYIPNARIKIRDAFLDIGLRNIAERTGLPLMEVELSRNDIAHFLHLYDNLANAKYYIENNRWRKAKLQFEGKKYKVKIRPHGRAPTDHKFGRYFSLAVKLQKGELIKGANRFSLIIRSRTNLYVVKKLFFTKKLALITQELEFIRVKINNWPERVFYFEYRLDNDFMESIGRSSLWRLEHPNPTGSHDKSLTYVSPDVYEDKKISGTSEDTKITKAELTARLTKALILRGVKTESQGPIIERYLAFHEAILNEDSKKLLQFFDQNYITNYAAARLIISLGHHSYESKNFINFYNQANGLFYPGINRDDWKYDLLILTPHQSIEKSLYQVPFLTLLSSNDFFRQKKYQTIMQIKDKYSLFIEQGLKEIWDAHYLHLDFGLLDAKIKSMSHEFKVDSLPNTYMTDNLDVLTAYLTEANPHITIWGEANILTMKIEPHSMSAIGFNRLEIKGFKKNAGANGSAVVSVTRVRDGDMTTKILTIKSFQVSKDGVLSLTDFIKGFEFFDGLDLDSNIVETTYIVKIKFDDIDITGLTKEAFNLSMRNHIIDGEILPNSITIEQGAGAYLDMPSAIRFEPKTLNGPIQIEAMRAIFPNINMSLSHQSELIIHPGVYKVTEDFILPRELKLIIEPGTTLLMDEGTAIFGYQGVDIKGTAEDPVIIKALDPSKPYGSIGFLGNGNTKNSIDYLYQSGGSERWINGIFFSGGFSIHYSSEVLLRNSRVENNHADDGANFKYVNHVLIENSIFQDNFSDQIDLDSSNARVINSQFLNTQKADLDGDGVDISSSEVLISNSKFIGFNDKGISIGERSKVIIQGSEIRNNNIGAAVKDISHAFFVNVNFKSNSKDIAAYRKKRIFGGGYAYIEPQEGLGEDKVSYDVDKQSKLFILNAPLSPKTLNFDPKKVNLRSILKTYSKIKTRPVDLHSLDN